MWTSRQLEWTASEGSRFHPVILSERSESKDLRSAQQNPSPELALCSAEILQLRPCGTPLATPTFGLG